MENRYSAYFLGFSLGCFSASLYAVNLIDTTADATLTHVDAQYNSSSWAGLNLTDANTSTRWLSSKRVNDLIYSFNPAQDRYCFDQLDLTNYGTHNRSISQFMLFYTGDTSLTTNTGLAGWLPVPADTTPADPINYLQWGQGGRLVSVNTQYNATSWAGKNLNDGDLASTWLSGKSNNVLQYDFDTDWNGLSGDAISIHEIMLHNYGASNRAVQWFQVEVTTDGANWSKLEVPGSVAGVADFNFALSHEGGVLSAVDAQYNATSWAGANIHDGDSNTRWLSARSNNTLDFAFDVDGDGTTGAAGDSDDYFNLDKIYLQNYGASNRAIRTFQVEVKTSTNPVWTKLEVPGSVAGVADFDFALSHDGGMLTAVNAQYNSSSWAGANIHDGDSNTRWLSNKSNNTLDFAFDADGDGTTGAAGDSDDYFTLDKFYLQNYGASNRAIKTFQVEVKTVANPVWTKLKVPGSAPGTADFNFALSADGGQLTAINSQYNNSNWAGANIHDGDSNTLWLSSKSNNILDFAFDTDGDGTTGAAGDSADHFTLDKIYLQNYGASNRAIKTFQVEVKTGTNPVWTKLEVPGSVAGEPGFNFLLSAEGGRLTSIDAQYNSSNWAAANIHDGDSHSTWLSNKPNNTLEFSFDTDQDGLTAAAGDGDDRANLDTVSLINYGSSNRSIQTFEVDVRINGGAWQTVTKAAGGTVFSALRSDAEQTWSILPVADVTAARLRTLTNYGDTYTGAVEFSLSGNSITPQHTFSAARNGNGETFVLDIADRPVDVTEARLRTISNYGDIYTGAAEFQLLGVSVTAEHSFTAAMHGNGETFVLDPADRPVDVTEARLRTISNYGDIYTGAAEFQLLGVSVTPSHTFTAARHGNGESFELDMDDRPVDVTELRLRTISNYGDTYTGAAELEFQGLSIAPSHTFIAPRSTGPHSYSLDVDDRAIAVIGARFITIKNYGDTYTGAIELGLIGPPVGANYIFEAQRSSALQSFSFDPVDGRLFRFHSLNNYGDTYTGAAEMALNSVSAGYCITPPVAYFAMDEVSWSGAAGEVMDASTNGLNGQALNGASTSNAIPPDAPHPGNPGTCRFGEFDGKNDYVRVPHNDLLNGDNALTYAAWIHPRKWSGINQVMAKSVHAGGSGRAQMGIFSVGNALYGRAETANGRIDISTSLPPEDQWTHVALVFTGSALNLYVNGSLASSSTFAATTLIKNTDELNIGKRVGSNQYHFDGYIDELRVYDTGLTVDQLTAVMNAVHPCSTSPVVDHFSINVGAGSANTCTAFNFTITAEDSSNNPVTGYSGTVSITTSTAHGNFSTVSATNTTGPNPDNDDNGNVAYTFDVLDNGVITLALANEHAETLTLSVTDSAIPVTSISSTVSFSDNAFLITDNDALVAGNDIPVAGRPHSYQVQMIRKDPVTGCGVAADYSGARPLKMWRTKHVSDPSPNAPVLEGTSLASIEPMAANGTVNFVAGVADVTLVTSDIGKFSIELADISNTFADITIAGSSSEQTVRPFGIGIDFNNLRDGDFNDNGAIDDSTGSDLSFAANAAGSVFTQAGEGFLITVEGVLWQNADDLDNNGVPDSTSTYLGNNPAAPSFGLEGETVTLVASLAEPAGATLGSLSGVLFDSFSSGSQTAAMSYSNVGIINLSASLTDADYFSSGVNLGGVAANVGRFNPYRYAVTASTVDSACNVILPFTYARQPFTTHITLEAQNKAGARTDGYTGAYATLDVSSELNIQNSATGAAYDQQSFTMIESFSSGTIGSSQFDVDLTWNMPLQAETQSEVTLIDSSDEVTLVAGSPYSAGSTELRFGRLAMDNVYGSELIALTMPMHSEYYNGNNFMRNTDDNCSVINDADLTVTSLLSGGSSSVSVVNPTALNGLLNIDLTPPGAGNTGSIDITLDLILSGYPWLQFDWDGDGSHDNNPAARATFGIYSGDSRQIYYRQIY